MRYTFNPFTGDLDGSPLVSSNTVKTVFNQDYTILSSDYLVVVLPTPTDNLTFYLPAVATLPVGKQYVIKSGGALGGFTLTVVPDGAETIDGAANKTLTIDYSSFMIINSGTTWYTM